jgi:glycosyltransferase involved in cell wall biosynthesis
MWQKHRVQDYILAVGPTYAHKNFERLLRAYAMLTEETRERHDLVIAGGLEPYLSILKSLAIELGIQDKVRFLGYLPQDDMPELYREASLFVFPSLYEGFGLPLLEAMASGCPVISSNTSSMPEVCGDAAKYVDPHDESDICRAIGEVLSDTGLRESLVEKGLQRCKSFTWESTAKSYRDLITHYELN